MNFDGHDSEEHSSPDQGFENYNGPNMNENFDNLNSEENFNNFQPNKNDNNVLESGGLCPNRGTYFTTDNELVDAQTNNIQNTNTMSQVQTWDNQLGPQGLNAPYGYSGPNQNQASSKPSLGQFASEF